MHVYIFNPSDRAIQSSPHIFDPAEFIDAFDGFDGITHEISENEDSANQFCFTDCGPGNIRSEETALTLHALNGYVEDSSLTLNTLVAKLDATGFSFLLYTGYTHSEKVLSAMFIVPFEQAVSASRFVEDSVVSRFEQLLEIHLDESSYGLSKAYPAPCCPAEHANQARIIARNTGKFLTLEDLPEMKSRSAKKSAVSLGKSGRNSPGTIAAEILETFFKNNLIYYGEQAYRFSEGYWQVISRKMLLKQLLKKFNDIYELSDIQKGLSELAIRQYEDAFPLNTLAVGIKNEPASVRLIGLKNVDIDPLTGTVYQHAPENYVKNQLPFNYDPQANCPVWMAFLQQTLANDVDFNQKSALLQEWMGYLMIPDTRFQKMLWLVGPGGTGKSTTLKVIELLLGSSNVSAVKLDRLFDRFVLAGMLDKLVNMSPEVKSGAKISDDTIKSIVGGDPVMIEFKGKDAFPAKLTIRLMAAVNILPRVSDYSNAFFRRLMILEFNHIVPEEHQDPNFVEKLETELSGIFNWALVGLQRLLTQNGFTIPSSSAHLVKNFEEDSDVVKKFIAEHCRASVKYRPLVKDVYFAFRAYCKQTGNSHCNDSEFGRRMSQAGFKSKKSKDRYFALEIVDFGNFNTN